MEMPNPRDLPYHAQVMMHFTEIGWIAFRISGEDQELISVLVDSIQNLTGRVITEVMRYDREAHVMSAMEITKGGPNGT